MAADSTLVQSATSLAIAVFGSGGIAGGIVLWWLKNRESRGVLLTKAQSNVLDSWDELSASQQHRIDQLVAQIIESQADRAKIRLEIDELRSQRYVDQQHSRDQDRKLLECEKSRAEQLESFKKLETRVGEITELKECVESLTRVNHRLEVKIARLEKRQGMA